MSHLPEKAVSASAASAAGPDAWPRALARACSGAPRRRRDLGSFTRVRDEPGTRHELAHAPAHAQPKGVPANQSTLIIRRQRNAGGEWTSVDKLAPSARVCARHSYTPRWRLRSHSCL